MSGTSSRRLCHVATFERGLNDEVGSSIKLPLRLNRGDRAGSRTAEKSVTPQADDVLQLLDLFHNLAPDWPEGFRVQILGD